MKKENKKKGKNMPFASPIATTSNEGGKKRKN